MLTWRTPPILKIEKIAKQLRRFLASDFVKFLILVAVETF